MFKSITPTVAFEHDTGAMPTSIPDGVHAVDVINPDRRRPILAINSAGELTVCCRRTARKHGWKIEGALFTRIRSAKRAAAATVAAGTKLTVDSTGGLVQVPAVAIPPARREADKPEAQRKAVVHIADAVHEALIAGLLADGKGK